jgi:hypothetical protein
MSFDKSVVVDFTSEGNLAAFKRYGWAVSERHGAWTDGTEAWIEINGLDPNTDYDCELYVTPYLAPPDVTEQDIVIKLASTEVLHERLSKSGVLRLTVPSAAIDPNGHVGLTLWCSTAIAPRALGRSMDSRRLGVSARYLTLRPVTPALCPQAKHSPESGYSPPAHLKKAASSSAVRRDGRHRLAAVTMTYNEPEYLPIWLRHYGNHVGLENCFVIDHGSDDGSTDRLTGCNVVKVPRSSYDPTIQSDFNSKFCSSLLCWYRRIIYSDVDELVMPDPAIAGTLREYCESSIPDVVTAIGLNVQHVPDLEGPLDLMRQITPQRSWVFPSSSMCKPLLINRDVRWSPGSHSADAVLAFDHLYLFHLRWVDFESGIRRLTRTRAMAWAAGASGDHARLTDDDWNRQLFAFAKLPRDEPADLEPSSSPLRSFLDAVRASQSGREFQTYKIDLALWGSRLWKLPDRFVGTF